MGNPSLTLVHDQYKVVESKGDKKFEDFVLCRHCKDHRLKRKADRMSKHLLNDCRQVPEDIKELVREQVEAQSTFTVYLLLVTMQLFMF